MQKKSGFKTSKIRRKKANPKKGLKRNSLVFCTLVLFICSIFVWFIQIFAEWMENLFLTYTRIQQQQHELYCLEHDDIACIWTSFKNIELPNFSNPSYIVAGGDVMLSRYIGTLWKREWYDRIFKEWNYNPLNEFENCKSDNCLLFLNLESLFCEPDNDVPKWGFDFRSNPKNIETLLQYRQDKMLLLALTNNHFSNWWYLWLTITKDLLDKHNIGYVWAWVTQEESREIFWWENNNIKFCLWAYSYDGKSARIRGGLVYWNGINEEEIKSDLLKMKDMNCDVKIVSLHRWAEYRFSPNDWQKNLAHSLIDSWADLILWGHSHIPWEFEIYNGKYIFYSLGNFLFDQSRWKHERW
jgi:poly-gamma-glutamate synthesis protein (capsule biosynthesis protein)